MSCSSSPSHSVLGSDISSLSYYCVDEDASAHSGTNSIQSILTQEEVFDATPTNAEVECDVIVPNNAQGVYPDHQSILTQEEVFGATTTNTEVECHNNAQGVYPDHISLYSVKGRSDYTETTDASVASLFGDDPSYHPEDDYSTVDQGLPPPVNEKERTKLSRERRFRRWERRARRIDIERNIQRVQAYETFNQKFLLATQKLSLEESHTSLVDDEGTASPGIQVNAEFTLDPLIDTVVDAVKEALVEEASVSVQSSPVKNKEASDFLQMLDDLESTELGLEDGEWIGALEEQAHTHSAAAKLPVNEATPPAAHSSKPRKNHKKMVHDHSSAGAFIRSLSLLELKDRLKKMNLLGKSGNRTKLQRRLAVELSVAGWWAIDVDGVVEDLDHIPANLLPGFIQNGGKPTTRPRPDQPRPTRYNSNSDDEEQDRKPRADSVPARKNKKSDKK